MTQETHLNHHGTEIAKGFKDIFAKWVTSQ